MLYFFWCLFDEMSNINAAREQYYKHTFTRPLRRCWCFTPKKNNCCRICCEGTGICFSSGWDCFDIGTAILSIGAIVTTWLLPFFVPLFTKQHEEVVSDVLFVCLNVLLFFLFSFFPCFSNPFFAFFTLFF